MAKRKHRHSTKSKPTGINQDRYTSTKNLMTGRKMYFPIVFRNGKPETLYDLPHDTARSAIATSLEWREEPKDVEDAMLVCAPDEHLEEIYEDRTQYEPDYGDSEGE